MTDQETTTEDSSEAPKADKTNKPEKTFLTPEVLRKRIEAGEKWQKSGHYKGSETRWKQWEQNKKHLMCVWDEDDENSISVNSIFSNYRTVLPTLYFKNPSITAFPTKPDFEKLPDGSEAKDENGQSILVDNYQAAKILGIKINYEFKELNFKKTVKKVLGDCLCPYGIGWVKWGYSKKSVGGHSNQRDRQYTYWCRRVDPRNLFTNWMATDSEDMTMTFERIFLTRKQAKKEGFNIPNDYKSVMPDFMKDRAEQAGSQTEDDIIIVWECHDLEEDVLYWMLDFEKTSQTTRDFIRDPESEPYPFEGSAYIPLVLNEDNDDIIGLSDAEPVEDQALAINRIRTKQTQHIDEFGTVTYYEDGSMDDKSIEDHITTPHGVYVKINKGHINAVRTEGTPSMGNDNYQMDSVHKEDMRLTLGITDYQQGAAVGRTATEANITQNAANIRIAERRDVIYDFIIESVRRLVAMIQEFGAEEEFINIADLDLDEDFTSVLKEKYGFNPKIPFLKMKKKDIQGEYDYKFNVEDMIVRPKEVQLQQLTNLLTVYLGNPIGLKALEDNDVSLAKAVNKSFELAGIDIEELKYGGPAEVPPEMENQMFQVGMEVPEPHRKDHDDEHIVSHNRIATMIDAQVQSGHDKMQQMTEAATQAGQQAQMAAQEAQQHGVDPSGILGKAQEIAQHTQAQLQSMAQQLMPLEQISRRIRLHIQAHEMARMKKAGGQSMPQAGGMPMGAPQGGMPQPAASQQVAMQSNAMQVQ